MKVLALYNLKGGVGKTAGTVNLAFYSALAGYRTLVWDLDPQGAASFYFRVPPRLPGGARELVKKSARGRIAEAVRPTDFEGLEVLPADFSFRNLDLELEAARKPKRRLAAVLEGLEGEYDVAYLDCPPSISLASESVFEAADALVVPTVPTPLSLRALEQVDRHLARHGPGGLRVLPYLSMVDRRRKLHRAGTELLGEIRDRLRRTELLLRAEIPYSSLIEQMGLRRAPLPAFAPASAPARAYLELWREIEERTGSG